MVRRVLVTALPLLTVFLAVGLVPTPSAADTPAHDSLQTGTRSSVHPRAAVALELPRVVGVGVQVAGQQIIVDP